MARKTKSQKLSAEQRRNVCLLLSSGCDRETAANFAGCSLADMRREFSRDATFAKEMRRSEAASEFAHMQNVQQASKDVKNWRASVWWLERRSPERFGRRAAGTVSQQHLESFVAQLATAVIESVHDPADQARLLRRFDHIVASLQQLILDSGTPLPAGSAACAPPFANEPGADESIAE